MSDIRSGLRFPVTAPPAPGEATEIADGVLWARLSMPLRLDHVNVYLLRDGDGWYVVDAGLDLPATRAAWEGLLAGPMGGRAVHGVIATHHHPDHIGLAGWLCRRTGAPLLTSRASYLLARLHRLPPADDDAPAPADGLPPWMAREVAALRADYRRVVAPLPPDYVELSAGTTLRIGGRRVAVLLGEGHAPEQVMLHALDADWFVAADQVMERISPHVAASDFERGGDPLGRYLATLELLARTIGDAVLVLPGHQRCFRGLAARAAELIGHHEDRLARIEAACAGGGAPSGRPRDAALSGSRRPAPADLRVRRDDCAPRLPGRKRAVVLDRWRRGRQAGAVTGMTDLARPRTWPGVASLHRR